MSPFPMIISAKEAEKHFKRYGKKGFYASYPQVKIRDKLVENQVSTCYPCSGGSLPISSDRLPSYSLYPSVA